MAIDLVMPDDPRTKIVVKVPHTQKNGHVKIVEFTIPKMQYIDRATMAQYRTWVKAQTKAYRDALMKVAEGDKTVELPDELTDIDSISELARLVFPTEWDRYLANLPDGVKRQLFTEWSEQSNVTVGESGASATSSDDQA